MHPILALFISGDSLYAGAALLLLAVFLSFRRQRPWILRARNIIAWIGLAMMIMASPPFPWTADIFFLVAFALWFYAVSRSRPSQRLTLGASLVFSTFLVVLPSIEFRHRMLPKLTGNPSDHLVVLGDSVSAGLGSADSWPAVFQQTTGIQVKNLAQPAASTADGKLMAEKVDARDKLVLVELGGNDMIMGGSSDQFGRNLDSILARLSMPVPSAGRTLVMFELPLLPQWIRYGQIQRRLAAKYGVILIPKRFLVAVLAAPNATSDGIHLTASGAHRMAALVADIFGPLLIKYPRAPAP